MIQRLQYKINFVILKLNLQVINIRFMSQREIQVYSYTLNIQSVKMKVKFPCKMKLQYAGQILTSEVSQNQSGKFIFNQEVTLKQDTDRSHFEIIAHISTDKGAKYIAGVIKLAQSELVHQQGQMMVIQLSKCLDPEACCQLRVDQVLSQKVTKKIVLQKGVKNRQFLNQFSPKKLLEVPKNFTGSRSQFQFPLNNNRQLNSLKVRQQGYQSIHEHSRSPIGTFRKVNAAVSYVQKNMPQFGYIDSHNRDKLIEAEVYKQSYQKLKQKYKREAQIGKQQLNKRIALQNNENNYKLQIMRLNLRCQEQDKSINEKNTKLKQMQIQLAGLQKKQLDLNYLREQASNKEHTIRMLQDTIRTLNKDNEDLKAINRERFENEQQKIRELRNQIDVTRQKYELKLTQIEKQLRSKTQLINQKDLDIKIREERIQREQRIVDQLQKQLQSKNFQFEKKFQNQQNEFKLKIEELKNVIQKLERQNSRLEQQIQGCRGQQQKIKSYVIKIEYEKKILSQEGQSFKSELSESKALRQKYQQLVRDHRLLTEDKNHLQKQFQKNLQAKDVNYLDLNKQFKQQIQQYKKNFKEVEQKLRSSQSKNLQLESQFEQKKNESQKLKKINESVSKECNELKQKQKLMKKSLKLKQDQMLSLVGELDSYKYKTKSGDQLSRYQIQNLKQQLGKFKKDLEIQMLRSAQLSEKNSTLNSEVNRLKLQIQQTSDSIQKDTTIFKDKISSLQGSNKQYERKIEDLNNIVSNLKASEKEKQQKIQKGQIQNLKLNERIEKHQRQIRLLQDKGVQYQNQIKNKQNQINNLLLVKQGLDKKLLENEDKLNTLKNNLNTTTGDKNKNEKIIELLNREINDLKQESERQSKLINNKQKTEEDLRTQLKKSKQQYLKLQMKGTAFKKQYDRFKEHLQQTLNSTYSQIPLSNADLRSSGLSIDILTKRVDGVDTSNFNVQILNKINMQNKQIKQAMTKLMEHNKMLQKDIDKFGQEGINNAAKNSSTISGLNKKIEQLQGYISRLQIEREESTAKNKGVISELQAQLQDRQNANKQLLLQIEEFNFTVNSLKMDQQASSEHFNLKISQYKTKISELEEKNIYLANGLNQSELNFNNLQAKLSEKCEQVVIEKDINSKKQKQLQVLRQEKKNLVTMVDEGKRQRKELLQKISQLELKLSTQRELKQKGRVLLEDEERKGAQLKQFVSNLMKQKQMAIKSDLEKSEQIINLEALLLDSNRQKQMKTQQTQRLKRALDEQKEIVKRLNIQIKDLEASGTDQKGRISKLNEKIREKQRQLKQNEQSLNKLRQDYQKLNSKSSKTIFELTSELEQNVRQKNRQIQELTERVAQFEKERQESQGKITNYKTQILMLQQNLFMEKQTNEVKGQQCNKLNESVENLKLELKKYQQSINLLNQQIKEKEQGMFQLSGKVYQLENAFDAKDGEYNQKVTQIIEDWSAKYENMIEQYQQRLDLVEKEKSYFKTRLEEKQEEYRKLVAELRNNELEDSGLRKALEQKVKRLQQQRLGLISSKNSQIQRLAEDNKIKFEQLKNKEADLRRVQHELQVARSTISKLQQSKRETQEKIKQINKAYQSQLEQLKKRQMINRSSTQNLQRIQWDVEREVKKTIQTFSKRISTNELKEDSQKILSTIKGLQDEVINAVSLKLSSVN